MTMTKKRLLLIATMPLAVAVTLAVLLMLPPSPGVTKANFDRIRTGMTVAEVEEAFGGQSIDDAPKRGGWFELRWLADDGSRVFIVFLDDCVASKLWPNHETFFDKIRRWLHLR
jgi:hypothetical protein